MSTMKPQVEWTTEKKKGWGLIPRICKKCGKELSFFERGINYCNKHKRRY